MLNKIKIIGKVLLDRKPEKEKNTGDSFFAEEMNNLTQTEFELAKENSRESWLYFSMAVPTPSDSITILRCISQGEIAERISQEVQEEEIIEVCGYLRNEKTGRQIIIKAMNFKKLDLTFSDLVSQVGEGKIIADQVWLLGKIVTNLQDLKNRENPKLLSFKLAVPREGVKYPSFFCRVHEGLAAQVSEKFKKGDVILLEGFLQTRIIREERESGEESKKYFPRISSIICQGLTFLDSDSARIFSHPLDNLFRVSKAVKKIDFTKPKTGSITEE